VRYNNHGVTEADLRQVRNLEYLKVKLLVRTAKHHTGLRMPEPVRLNPDPPTVIHGGVSRRF